MRYQTAYRTTDSITCIPIDRDYISIRWARQYNDPMYPAIFLDRDGVLIENRPDYVRDWLQVKLIPEAIEALSLAAARPYKIVIVTNQSAVGRGFMPQATAEEINRRLVNLIHHHGGQVDAVYMCPHKPDDDCLCRKPKPGLLLQAAKELRLDLQRSWMIGDAWSDLQAGQRAGVQRTILLRTGRGEEQLRQPCPAEVESHLIFDNLPLAFDAIFATGNPQTIST